MGLVAVFTIGVSGCAGPGLTIINESSAWLRVEAAAEHDPRAALYGTPTPGREAVEFGVPPGARFERDVPPGGSIFVRRRLGMLALVRAGPNPQGHDARDPTLYSAFRVRLAPPGPYRLLVTGEPGLVEVRRADASGGVWEDGRSLIVPEAENMFFLGFPQ